MQAAAWCGGLAVPPHAYAGGAYTGAGGAGALTAPCTPHERKSGTVRQPGSGAQQGPKTGADRNSLQANEKKFNEGLDMFDMLRHWRVMSKHGTLQ